jgi:predicted dehydrogenase
MVREARRLVQDGRLGPIRVVQAEYAIGSRSRLVEATGDARFAWRVDPAIGGPSTVLGDIGTHAHHLLRTITGLEVAALSADLSSLVPGRTAHDNADINLRLTGGARGHFWASMVANGAGQALRLRVWGERAGLEWHQQMPDELRLMSEDEPISVLRRGDTWLAAEAKRATRTQRGQPEGYIGAFANIYNDFAEALHAGRERRPADPAATSFATATDGVVGMAFVEAAVASSARDGAWTAPMIPGEDGA